jgi:hypothetical protein
MELASMLAGEPFSDHPQAVSPTIGSFMRNYNDLIDDERRQDLYEYAAKIVGTSGSPESELARAARLVAWAEELWEERARRSIADRIRRRVARDRRRAAVDHAARYAMHAIGRVTDESHRAALRLVDELVAIRSPRQATESEQRSSAGPRVKSSDVPDRRSGHHRQALGAEVVAGAPHAPPRG